MGGENPWVLMVLSLVLSVLGFHLGVTTKVDAHAPSINRSLLSYARFGGWAIGIGSLLAFVNLLLTVIFRG